MVIITMDRGEMIRIRIMIITIMIIIITIIIMTLIMIHVMMDMEENKMIMVVDLNTMSKTEIMDDDDRFK